MKLTTELLASIGATNEAEFPVKLAERMTQLSALTPTVDALKIKLDTALKDNVDLAASLGKANDEIKVLRVKLEAMPTPEQIKAEAKTEASRVTAEALGATGNNPLVKAGKGDEQSAPIIDTFEAAVKAQSTYATDRVAAVSAAKKQFPELYKAWGMRGGSAHL